MQSKLIYVLSAAVIMSTVAFGAHAADKLNYDSKSFAAAQAAGKPILVEIHATWCPTCRAQALILSDLEKQDKSKNLTVFRVDFDSQKDAVKAFGARMQSTLITFKGSRETGRSVGDTNPSSIAAFRRFGGFSKLGLSGQFGVGLLLGTVWSPCVGPTLGAASVLAAQGKNLGAVALTMLIFGLGAGLPLMLFGSMSRHLFLPCRAALPPI